MASERFSVRSPDEVMSGWTLDDVEDAHAVLDMYVELDARAAAEQERRANRK